MRKEINITNTCQLEIETEPESTFLGWKYAIGDGGSGGASTFATLTTDAEFNRLAMEAPIVKRMVEYIKCDYVGYAVDYPRACMRDSLLTDIKALEKPE